MAYPPNELTFTNINLTESFDLDKFNTRFSDLKTYAESLKEGVDAKVDKVNNYGLSKNDFTDSYKSTLDNLYESSNTNKNGHKHSISEITDLSTFLDNKVNKDGSKVLSDYNFDSNYKSTIDVLKSTLLTTVETRNNLQSNSSTNNQITISGTASITVSGFFSPISAQYGAGDVSYSSGSPSYSRNSYGFSPVTTTSFSDIVVGETSSSFKMNYSVTFNHYEGSQRCVWADITGYSKRS